MADVMIILHGQNTTLILELDEGRAPLWRYWGPRLASDAAPQTPLRDTRPLPTFSFDYDQPLPVFPGLGTGWLGQTALLAHRAGRDWTFEANRCSTGRPDDNSAVITLTDDTACITVTITLALDPDCDVLTISTSLTNTGDGVLDVQWLAAGGIPLPAGAARVRSYSGRHNNEFMPIDDILSRSVWRRENRRGLTSHDCFPGGIVTCENGIVYGAQFAWSGNHVQDIEWTDDGRYHWQMGEWLAPGEIRLACGETMQTPEMITTCATDTNAMAQNFHAFIRKRMQWHGGIMKPRPVHINTWEGFYFSHDVDALKALADSAAELGIERYVLDDGWFHGRHDDTSSLGDWWPDAGKYPDGLKPLADYVTELGMEFGLWVEPEMVNPNSELYRKHPKWALHINGRPQITGRNQLVLDLTQAEVSDYLYVKIASLLSTLPVSYLKWDHNRDLTSAGAQPRYRRQVQAAYDLMARIRKDFPHVEIEACAGGGGRTDAGIIRYTHRFWTSDCIDAVSRAAMQRAFLMFMPPEVMGSHVGTAPAHSTGRSQSMDFRAAVALPGHFGVELDVRTITDEDRARLKHWIAEYKAHRDILHSGKMWTGEAGDSILWQAHGNNDNLIVFLYRMQPMGQRYMPALRLPMLNPDKEYRIDGGAYEGVQYHGVQYHGVRYHGAWLQSAGLPIQPDKAETCQMIKIAAL